jgi:molecular chaperone GrpE
MNMTDHKSINDEGQKTQDEEESGQPQCAQCVEYLSGWKRAQADYANLKKESEKARGEIAEIAKEQVLYEMLPVMDQFEVALEHLPDIEGLPEEGRRKIANWLVGIKAVKQLWDQRFKAIGLENVDTSGVFDPNKHTAVGKEEDTDQPPDQILKVIQSGWMLNGKVIRPAKVIVNLTNE